MSVYVAQVGPRAEFRVAEELRRIGIPAYAPAITTWRYCGGRKGAPTNFPLTPGYVFLWSTSIEEELGKISETDGVVRMLRTDSRPGRAPARRRAQLGGGGELLTLAGDWLERVWWAQTFGALDHTRVRKPSLRPGQQVRIIGGQFQGALAAIAELRSNGRVKLKVSTKGLFGVLVVRAEQLEVA